MRQADLQSADEQATRLYKDLNEIAQYSESQKLIAILIGIRPKIKEYMSQVNQGLKSCEEVRAIQDKRRVELSPYLQFLDETDNWLKGITLTLNELNANYCTVCAQSTCKNNQIMREKIISKNFYHDIFQGLQGEVEKRIERLTDLELAPEINEKATALKDGLVQVLDHLRQKQKVYDVYKTLGALKILTAHHMTAVMGIA